MAGPKLSIMDAIVANKRAAQGAPASKLTVDDVNYRNRNAAGPDGSHRSIQDLWCARWVNNIPFPTGRLAIDDRMMQWFGGVSGPSSAHMSNADYLAAYFSAAGRP